MSSRSRGNPKQELRRKRNSDNCSTECGARYKYMLPSAQKLHCSPKQFLAYHQTTALTTPAIHSPLPTPPQASYRVTLLVTYVVPPYGVLHICFFLLGPSLIRATNYRFTAHNFTCPFPAGRAIEGLITLGSSHATTTKNSLRISIVYLHFFLLPFHCGSETRTQLPEHPDEKGGI